MKTYTLREQLTNALSEMDAGPTRERYRPTLAMVPWWHWWHRFSMWSEPFPQHTQGQGIFTAAFSVPTEFRQGRHCRRCGLVQERKVLS